MKFTPENVKFMQHALNLAKKGRHKVFPNPMVGCVIVKNSKIIAEGYHKVFGALHAEADALNSAGLHAKGADLYVNLEPCCNFGKRPPCADYIINSGISRVFVSHADPNPLTRNNGIKKLKVAGVAVYTGLLEKEAKLLNKDYINHIKKTKNFVSVKYAMTLDGKIATRSYSSKWITGEAARKYTHKLRAGYNAVLAGFNTVIKDNPSLTVRGGSKPVGQPVRIVIDQSLKTPKNYNVLNSEAATVFVCDEKIKKVPAYFLKDGIIILKINFEKFKEDFKLLISRLNDISIKTIFIEGGGETIASALFSGAVNKVYAFVAPSVIGGKTAISPVGGVGVNEISNALKIKKLTVKKIGKDFLFEGNL
ncbi:MAG: bifunctional diaminohydroxyphosphoribosylaminopyrimidine deaminase/5-amino-6-(5-phosphoribosylamino)uracil reductase RibD [Elusimicrobia bacterium]|nr:bifunctional diaminohydroxyphosphoribosylaminopyrimidine deaminase/5-amino-6-(5-phosphoribosylamino)uracil reductase RibD [Elusimicrobiota bacterium]